MGAGDLCMGAGGATASVGSSTPHFSWRRLVGAGIPEDLSALAVDATGRLAFASKGRVSLITTATNSSEVGAAPRFLARVERVHDLAFLSGGDLLIASDRGLWRVDGEGRVVLQPLGGTARGRAVNRVVTKRGVVATAGAAGVHVRLGLARWQSLGGALPIASASAVALCRVPTGDKGALELFAVAAGKPWHVTGRRVGDRLEDLQARELTLPGAVGLSAPVDVLCAQEPRSAAVGSADSGGWDGDVWLYSDALTWRSSSNGTWRRVRPSWPAETVARRIAFLSGRLFVASDRALLEASRPDDRWQRAGSPAGTSQLRAVVSAGEGSGDVYAAGAQGLLRGSPARPRKRRLGTAPPRAPSDPGIALVQRKVLSFQGLDPRRIRDLESRVNRRAWLPELGISLGLARDRDEIHDRDQSFVSGDVRRLRDFETRRARDYEARVSLSWELADTVFDPESIDVSREARSLVALRDDVLDEVNQLYFERRSLLLSLLGESSLPADERQRRELRAAELGAGLDAWTGGWFSAEVARADARLR